MTTEQISQQVRQTLAQLQQLAQSDQPTAQVVHRMLDLLVQTTQCNAALAWLGGKRSNEADLSFHLAGRAGHADPSLNEEGGPLPPVAEALGNCFAQPDKAMVVSPDQAEFADTPLSPFVQFYLPIAATERTLGVLQLIAPGELDPKVYREYVAFAQQTARAITEYLNRRRGALRDEEASRTSGLLQMVRRLAEIDDPEAALHEAASSARRLLGAQRAAAVKLWDKRPKVLFADTLDTHRKAVVVRAARLLAEQAQQREVPMVFARGRELDEEERDLAPLIDDLFDQGSAQSICIVPIHDGDAAIGALICEYEAQEPGESASFQQQVAEQVGPMLGRLVRWRQRPLRRTAGLIEKIKRHPRAAAVRTAVIVAIIALLGVGLFATPVPVPIRVDARLEPLAMATVTAPFAGQVDNVLVRSGDDVSAGQPLIELNTDDLQAQFAEVTKQIEIHRVKRELAHREATRQGGASRADVREAELQIARLEIRRGRIERMIEQATIRAPMAGRVLNEDLEQLAKRNLREGDGVVQIGDLRHFRLTMDIEEADLAPIQRRLADGHDVPVTFISRSLPDVTHTATIADLGAFSPTAVGDPQKQKHVFHATVPIELEGEAKQLAMANPSGRARLDVGTGSVVYRYFRRAYHFFRMKLWF